VRRFKKSKKAWKEFPNQVAIQVSAPLLWSLNQDRKLTFRSSTTPTQRLPFLSFSAS
jgi:hypothetical protein